YGEVPDRRLGPGYRLLLPRPRRHEGRGVLVRVRRLIVGSRARRERSSRVERYRPPVLGPWPFFESWPCGGASRGPSFAGLVSFVHVVGRLQTGQSGKGRPSITRCST